MTDPRAAARFWAATSVFEPGAARSAPPLPLALVAEGPSAGRDLGRAPSALLARPALGSKAMPSLRLPVILDAAPLRESSPKVFAAVARGAAAAGAALQVTPRQQAQREAVLKASGAPLVLRTEPGDPPSRESSASASALCYALAGADGAPAVLAEDALPWLVQSLRALTSYRTPVVILAHPGRLPSAPVLRAVASAGAAAICLHEGEGPTRLPLAALAGEAAALRASGSPLEAFLATDAVTDGIELACALALGGGLVSASLPLRIAAADESATDADWKSTGDRLGQALRVMWEDAQRASALVGVRDPRDLTAANVRALTYDAAALSGLKLAGYGERLPWWTH